MYIIRISNGMILPGIYSRYDDAKQFASAWTEKNSPYWATVERLEEEQEYA